MNVEPGQVWNERGVLVTVERVGPDGSATVSLMETGELLPVRPSFFRRARLVDLSEAQDDD